MVVVDFVVVSFGTLLCTDRVEIITMSIIIYVVDCIQSPSVLITVLFFLSFPSFRPKLNDILH